MTEEQSALLHCCSCAGRSRCAVCSNLYRLIQRTYQSLKLPARKQSVWGLCFYIDSLRCNIDNSKIAVQGWQQLSKSLYLTVCLSKVGPDVVNREVLAEVHFRCYPFDLLFERGSSAFASAGQLSHGDREFIHSASPICS